MNADRTKSAVPHGGGGWVDCPAQHLALVGMMGSGKSTVGRVLAAELQWQFTDIDRKMEELTRKRVSEIWAAGEGVFRELETKVLRSVLTHTTHGVVAGSGGVVLRAENRDLLQQYSHVVWLRASTPTLVARVASAAGRPLLREDREAMLKKLNEERWSLYEEVAHRTIDVDHMSVTDVAREIRSQIESVLH